MPVIAEVANASASDVDAAVAAARAALDGPWGKMSARERGRLVWKLGDRLMEKIDETANRVIELGFLRRLGADHRYEVRPILKARISSDALAEVLTILEQHASTDS